MSGRHSVWLAPAKRTKLRTQLAELAGGWKSGRCVTSAIALAVGQQEDPAVTSLLVSVGEWLKFWGNQPALQQSQVIRAWVSARRRLQAMPQRRRWHWVRGPMTSLIVQLLEIEWTPLFPHAWISPAGTRWQYSARCEDLSDLNDALEQAVMARYWKRASEFYLGAGLELGADLRDARIEADKMRKDGQAMQAGSR